MRKWFRTIGFSSLAESLNFDQRIIEEFRDGILLCRIIEHLERREIKGMIRKPTSKAGCIVNIRKALDVLKQKSAMKLNYLYREEVVQKGARDTIIELLLNIRTAYKRELRYLTKQK